MSAADLITSAPSREPARHSLTTRIVIYGLLALFALVYIIPLVVMVNTSLKPLDEVTGGNMFALPQHLTFEPWIKAWGEARIGVSETPMRASPQALIQGAKVRCCGMANMLPPVTSSRGLSEVLTMTTSGTI